MEVSVHIWKDLVKMWNILQHFSHTVQNPLLICYFMMALGQCKTGRKTRIVGGSATRSSDAGNKRRVND
jgi:hypothetical protein